MEKLREQVRTATGSGLERIQLWVVGVAVLCLVVGVTQLTEHYGLRHGALFLVGSSLGLVLYHARFGFTTAFRLFVATGDGRGIRAQMLMLTVTTMLFAPILALNDTAGGAVAPVSLSVLIGACMFSIGMQLGGG
jgi:uncharacterized membrane protein YedE/YeeE